MDGTSLIANRGTFEELPELPIDETLVVITVGKRSSKQPT